MMRHSTSLTFVHATDLHYFADASGKGPRPHPRLACFISDINSLSERSRIDFVILSGDISQRGAASRRELAEAKQVYDGLRVPYYVVAGNHDLAPNRRYAAMYPGGEDYHEGPIRTSNFAAAFGSAGLKFSFMKGNLHFIGVSLRDGDPDGMLDWLENQIRSSRRRKIIVTHYGLYPPRDAGQLLTWGFGRIASIIPRLRSIVENPAARVVAYLYGHNHVNSVIMKNGVLHVSGGGIQSGCTGYRVFRCFDWGIVSDFRLISDPELHDFNHWGKDDPARCADSKHGTVAEYHGGSSEEQRFVFRYGLPGQGSLFSSGRAARITHP